MKKLREHQMILLKMLVKIRKIMSEKGINFFLVGGSTLGAIRHKGFIPWDDDIDIGLYRGEFEKLEKVINDINLGKIKYSKAEEDIQRAPAPYGCFYYEEKGKEYIIDVYAIDSVPNNIILKKIQKYSSYMYHLSVYRNTPKNRGKLYFYLVSLFLKLTPNNLLNIFQKISKKIILKLQKVKSDNIVNMYGIKGYEKEIMPKEYIGKPILWKFENEIFYIPEQWDKYLTHLYGDYMKLPPLEEQKPKHGRGE